MRSQERCCTDCHLPVIIHRYKKSTFVGDCVYNFGNAFELVCYRFVGQKGFKGQLTTVVARLAKVKDNFNHYSCVPLVQS
jgi:hypothetical protein